MSAENLDLESGPGLLLFGILEDLISSSGIAKCIRCAFATEFDCEIEEVPFQSRSTDCWNLDLRQWSW